MALSPSNQYLKTQIMTASPEALQLMLWDGAIRFAEQGKEAILKKDIEGSYKTLLRSQKIIMEMNAALRPSVDRDLCGKLASLYNYIYRRLVDANLHKNPQAVDEALVIMRHQRETWVMLMDKLAKDRATGATDNAEPETTAAENAAAFANSSSMPTASVPLPRPASTSRKPYATAPKPSSLTAATLSVQG